MAEEITQHEYEDQAGWANRFAADQKHFYCNLPKDRQAKARAALRRVAETSLFKTDDGMANVALEELWNILNDL